MVTAKTNYTFHGYDRKFCLVQHLSLETSLCSHCKGLYPQDDPFEKEELQGLQVLMNTINAPCTVEEYITANDEIAVCPVA